MTGLIDFCYQAIFKGILRFPIRSFRIGKGMGDVRKFLVRRILFRQRLLLMCKACRTRQSHIAAFFEPPTKCRHPLILLSRFILLAITGYSILDFE